MVASVEPAARSAGIDAVAPRLIETDAFPSEAISQIAERESWRKEINRPTYHIHKWWAQRLGSVFRAIAIAAAFGPDIDLQRAFYKPTRLDDLVVFDPFMGSGTTIGEVLKLGGRAIGRDINPVAALSVRTALTRFARDDVMSTFAAVERECADAIRSMYRTQVEGTDADVLYYFWVKVVTCPSCDYDIDLFGSYMFAKHAYPSRHPRAQAVCPHCGDVQSVRSDAASLVCTSCHVTSDIRHGPARGAFAECPSCGTKSRIIDAIRREGGPPRHRMYAKLVLRADGSKSYHAVGALDRAAFDAVPDPSKQGVALPVGAIAAGYNTNQILRYGYARWEDLFNKRQLYCLRLLSRSIQSIPDSDMRSLFVLLLSGTLEFNNMFASYKGEGTGAVRHMFSHHILKPERTPLEANVWGTRQSSGSFSTLFKSRLLRALDYSADPFEVSVQSGAGKVHGLSRPIASDWIARSANEFDAGARALIDCGDSARTDLDDGSVDLVITDPPFFDNVNYSELADFFYAWQAPLLGLQGETTTRQAGEVQQRDPLEFASRLSRVLQECQRVLKPGGLLIFTYHHSRDEGWTALLRALRSARFTVVACHALRSEMTVAAPKAQASSPISIDVVVVCRVGQRTAVTQSAADLFDGAARRSESQVKRLGAFAARLSRNDLRTIVMSEVVAALSRDADVDEAMLAKNRELRDAVVDRLHATTRPPD